MVAPALRGGRALLRLSQDSVAAATPSWAKVDSSLRDEDRLAAVANRGMEPGAMFVVAAELFSFGVEVDGEAGDEGEHSGGYHYEDEAGGGA